MILSLKKTGLGPTKTTKDELWYSYVPWDTQNVNSIFRNIGFQRCKYLSFCWLCFYFITERISCWLYTEETWWFLRKHFLNKKEWDSIFSHTVVWISLKCSEGGFILFSLRLCPLLTFSTTTTVHCQIKLIIIYAII